MHPADKIQSSFNIQEGGVVHTAIIVFLNGWSIPRTLWSSLWTMRGPLPTSNFSAAQPGQTCSTPTSVLLNREVDITQNIGRLHRQLRKLALNQCSSVAANNAFPFYLHSILIAILSHETLWRRMTDSDHIVPIDRGCWRHIDNFWNNKAF
jgi:hypothetical protein